MLTTDNEVLLRNYKETLVIQCAQRAAEKVIPTEEDVIKSNILSFGTLVGTYTNYVTSWYDVLSQYNPGSIEYEQTMYRIICGQHYTQSEIDKSKGCKTVVMKRFWHDRRAAAKRDDEVGGDLHKHIVADRKPRFMCYRYPALSQEYNAFIKKANYDCTVQFGYTAAELLALPKKTKAQAEMVKWIKANSPVALGNCTMNRICAAVEEALRTVKNKWKDQGSGFNYSIYRTPDTSYDAQAYIAIMKILDRYSSDLKTLSSYAKANRLDDVAVSSMRKLMAEVVKEECYCNCRNSQELANVVLDLTYGQGKPSQIPWDICSDVIIANLLRRNHGVIHYYERDAAGTIDYGGEHFTKKDYVMEDDNYSSNE